MFAFLYTLSILVMLLGPLLGAVVLRDRLGTRWRLLAAGALTFVASQLLHIPLNGGVAYALHSGWLPPPPAASVVWLLPLALGLSAGLCEELARYVGLRFFLRDDASWSGGVGYGLGHGGVESVILGLLAALTLVNMLLLRAVGAEALGVPAGQLALVQAQLSSFWGAPWYVALLPGVERLAALSCHLWMAVLVALGVSGRWWGLPAAIAWHTALDAWAVGSARAGLDPLWIEAGVVGFGLASLLGLWWLRPARVPPTNSPPRPLAPIGRVPLARSAASLEQP